MSCSDCVRDRKVQVAMLAAYVIFVFSANITQLFAPNSRSSNKFYTLVTPPGWAFSIWGLIFVAQAASLICALVPKTSGPAKQVFDWQLASAWIATCVLQSVWSFVFAYTVDFAAVLLALSVVSTVAQQILALRRIAALREDGTVTKFRGIVLYVACVVPFSIHGGWTAAAAGLNANIAGVNHELTATAQLAFAIGTLLWGFAAAWTFGVFGTPLSAWSSDPAYAGALVWALYAIASHSTSRPENAVDAVVTFPDDSIIPPALSRVSTFAATLLVVAIVARGAVDAARLTRADDVPSSPTKVHSRSASLTG